MTRLAGRLLHDRRASVGVAAGCAALFVVLHLLVSGHVTDHLDVAVRDWLRPGDEWERAQVRAEVVARTMAPRNAFGVLVLAGLVSGLIRRSWRPAAVAVLLVGSAGVLTVLTKVAVRRTDPHDELTSMGSFPSGHMVAIVVCAGGVLLISHEHARWAPNLVGNRIVGTGVVGIGLVGTVLVGAMSVALLLQATHWLTDVVGGALLALAVLGGVSAVAPLRGRRAADHPAARRRTWSSPTHVPRPPAPHVGARPPSGR